jgi:hypothetical protein
MANCGWGVARDAPHLVRQGSARCNDTPPCSNRGYRFTYSLLCAFQSERQPLAFAGAGPHYAVGHRVSETPMTRWQPAYQMVGGLRVVARPCCQPWCACASSEPYAEVAHCNRPNSFAGMLCDKECICMIDEAWLARAAPPFRTPPNSPPEQLRHPSTNHPTNYWVGRCDGCEQENAILRAPQGHTAPRFCVDCYENLMTPMEDQ